MSGFRVREELWLKSASLGQKCDESLLDWAQVDGVVLDIDASQAVVDGIQHGVNQVVAFLSANHRLVVLVAEVNRHPEADGLDTSVATEPQGHLARARCVVLQNANDLGLRVDGGDEQGCVRSGRPHGVRRRQLAVIQQSTGWRLVALAAVRVQAVVLTHGVTVTADHLASADPTEVRLQLVDVVHLLTAVDVDVGGRAIVLYRQIVDVLAHGDQVVERGVVQCTVAAGSTGCGAP